MLPDEFRKDKIKVREFAKLMATPIMQEVMPMLWRINPVVYPLPKTGATPADHSRQLGMIEGHYYTLQVLETLGILNAPKQTLKETYDQDP